MKLTVIHDLVEAEAVWRDLEATSVCSYYQTYDWLSAWMCHVGESSAISPRIVLLSHDDDVAHHLALLPLGLRQSGAGRGLQWLGCQASSYLGPILTEDALGHLDEASLDRLFEALPAHGIEADYVDLDCQPEQIGGYRNPFALYRSEPTGQRSHLTALAGDWASYYAKKRSNKTRQKDRNRLRQIRQYGEVAFKMASSPDEIRILIDRLIVEKTRQFNQLGVRNVFQDRRIEVLFRDVALVDSTDGPIKLFAVTLDDDPIAIAYCAVHRAEMHGIFLCYMDNEVTRLGPGTVLLHHIFEWSFAKGIRSFDFSIGDQDYKRHWCETANPLHRSLWPITRRGTFYVQSTKMTECLKSKMRSSATVTQWARRFARTG
jgi:CelD/BcsL family acetyltransferase involved in cellulose biosynthesis